MLFLKRTLFLLLVTAFPILETGAREKLPNIILIVSDDQGYADVSFSSYAMEYVNTPNLHDRECFLLMPIPRE